MLPAAMTGNDVIERQIVSAPPAVLTGVVVTHEDFLARHLHDRARTLHVVGEPNHGRRWEREALARNEVAVLLHDARLLLAEEDHRPAHVAHVERLTVDV